MPSILEELLTARKSTRKLIPQEKDEFMKNVLDKRQLGYKVTANSLYGQCGAKTSTFYEKDIAACTTATGRLLLTYAKKIIEECYGDAICHTKDHGPVLTKAEYIYGDSVANYTPVYVKKGDKVEVISIERLAEKYGGNLWVLCREEGKQEKEYCELDGIETWTEKGWTKLHRVIRHTLAFHKKMVRVVTPTAIVDVTDDHSLLLKNGKEISPNNVQIGTELLHHKLPFVSNNPEKYIVLPFDDWYKKEWHDSNAKLFYELFLTEKNTELISEDFESVVLDTEDNPTFESETTNSEENNLYVDNIMKNLEIPNKTKNICVTAVSIQNSNNIGKDYSEHAKRMVSSYLEFTDFDIVVVTDNPSSFEEIQNERVKIFDYDIHFDEQKMVSNFFNYHLN
jgi:hypothetical protein